MSATDHEEVVRRSFERQVPLFSGKDSVFASPQAASALAWAEPLTDDMIVLDVACGAAHAAEPIAPRVRQVVGIDLTPALLHLGAQRLRDAGIGNVMLQEGNAEALPFVDESFDVVYCRSSLHHFADPSVAVAEMTRVCRVGGRVVLLDLVAPLPDNRDQFDHIHRLLDPSHVRTLLEPELLALLPEGADHTTSRNTSGTRLPLDLVLTDQSQTAEVRDLLGAEARGEVEPTGFDPVDEDGKLTVTFVTCTVQFERT